ncbi:MAG: imidazole glycerol phosphate synthase subunit HisH [Spirochaetaceae bacterium]|jgi:glutamine amidotransferase|nr:imidazole glycerol phosphate synthase subunit HisH [Spirochaetaceae bacterium]
MIGIVDYNAGNIRSVELALRSLGLEYHIAKRPSELEKTERLIFPGVGDAAYAMKQLSASGFDSFLKEYAASGRYILGVCLGSQIIFSRSEEGADAKVSVDASASGEASYTECLGLIPGVIRHFDALLPSEAKEQRLKIPHMGWNNIRYPGSKTETAAGSSIDPLFRDIPENSDFYFVHSYVIQPENPDVVTAYADYGIPVPAAVRKGSVFAVQFHPEKSGAYGLKLLKNFAEM